MRGVASLITSLISPSNLAFVPAFRLPQSIEDAASVCGVGVRTVKRWLSDSDSFARRIRELRSHAVSVALGRMTDGMAEASDSLRDLLSAESESVRLGACRAMLELGVKLRDQVDLEDRVRELEQQLLASKEGDRWHSRAG